MQKKYVVVERSYRWHGESIRITACYGYITECADSEDFPGKIYHEDHSMETRTSGSTPYTSIEMLETGTSSLWIEDRMAEMGTVKIVFNSSTFAGGIVQRWVNDGCLWTSYASLGAGSQGTSNSAPLVASALASVLAVFPDTAPVELAKFAKACAKRSGTDRRGNTIAALLRQSGGVGVADFTCMGDTTTALANLPNGGSTRVTINGKPVTVSGRDLVLFFGNMMQSVPIVGQDGFSLIPVVTDEQSIMFVGIWKGGSYFASTGSGLRGDFFGFTEGHREVFDLQVAEVTRMRSFASPTSSQRAGTSSSPHEHSHSASPCGSRSPSPKRPTSASQHTPTASWVARRSCQSVPFVCGRVGGITDSPSRQRGVLARKQPSE